MTEPRRVRMTKKLLKDSLLELLEHRPLGKITIKEICDNADVNRTTFYVHYETIEALLQEIENEVLEQIPVPSTAEDERLQQILTDFFDYVQDNKQLFRILMLRPDSSAFNSRMMEAIMEKYRKQAMVKDTLISKYRYIYCVNGAIGLMKEWIANGFPISSERFAEIVRKMSVMTMNVDEK